MNPWAESVERAGAQRSRLPAPWSVVVTGSRGGGSSPRSSLDSSSEVVALSETLSRLLLSAASSSSHTSPSFRKTRSVAASAKVAALCSELLSRNSKLTPSQLFQPRVNNLTIRPPSPSWAAWCRSFHRLHSTMTAPHIAPILPASSLSPPDSTTRASLSTAASILQSGGLVAFPTETVYGLGASALSESAVRSIYTAKGRPSDNPLIVHVSSRSMLHDLIPGGAAGVPAMYEPLLTKFWPGPLSLIFPFLANSTLSPPKRQVAASVTAGQPSLAIRMPAHPLALALISEADLPLAAPSANLSSRPSPTTAEHVRQDLGTGRGVGAILDGGECAVGVESTVVDFVPSLEEGGLGELRVLRAGGVSAEDLEACLRDAGFGAVEADGTTGRIRVYARDFRSTTLEEAPTTPGMKYKHYSPTNARVVLVRRSIGAALPTLRDLVRITADSSSSPRRVGLMFTDETLALCGPCSATPLTPQCSQLSLSHVSLLDTSFLSYPLGSTLRPLEAAQRLFAGLRYFDSLETEEGGKVGVDLIMVECVEESGLGLAVMERARKAAGGSGELEMRVG